MYVCLGLAGRIYTYRRKFTGRLTQLCTCCETIVKMNEIPSCSKLAHVYMIYLWNAQMLVDAPCSAVRPECRNQGFQIQLV